MPDVIIKGMEMPKNCYSCHLRKRNGMEIICPVSRKSFSVADVNILHYRLKDCPLRPAAGWISVDERLPEENVYVLVWCGEIKIAQIIRGISKEQRAKMQEGTIDDPVSYGWNLSNGYFEVKRSESYRACDENGNNKVPYYWNCIYGRMFGQDVKAWMPLPEPPVGGDGDG